MPNPSASTIPTNLIVQGQEEDEIVNKNEICSNYRTFALESNVLLLQREKESELVEGWQKAKVHEDIEVWKTGVLGSQWNCLKAVTKINAPGRLVADLLNDAQKIPMYDEMIEACTVLEKYTQDIKISVRHVYAKAVFPTAPRDFVVLTTESILEDGRIIISSRSLDEHKNVPLPRGYVRGKNLISGYIVKSMEGENTCQLTMICHLDLGGSVPPYLINFFSMNAPIKLMSKVRELCEVKVKE